MGNVPDHIWETTQPEPSRLREAERDALFLHHFPGQDPATFEATRRRVMACYDAALASTPAHEDA